MISYPPSQNPLLGFQIFDTSTDGAIRQRHLKASGLKGALAYNQIRVSTFMRELAKIAHGYATWNVGIEGFRPLLLPNIQGTEADIGYLIGCNFNEGPLKPFLPAPAGVSIYQIYPFETKIRDEKYLGCQIRLFATERPLTPAYMIIFGQPIS